MPFSIMEILELESSDSVWEGIHVVRGNCDYDSGYPERLVVKLGDVGLLRKRMVISLGLILPRTSWIFGHNKRMLISVYMGTLHGSSLAKW